MYQPRTWTVAATLLVSVLTQAAIAQRPPSGPDFTDEGPGSRPSDIVNGDFEAGLDGWTWQFNTNDLGQFAAQGQADAMIEGNQPVVNTVMDLSNSVQLPMTQFGTASDSGRPGAPSLPGPTDDGPDAPPAADVVSTVIAQQQFDYTGGDVLIAFTSVGFGIELAEASDVRVSAAMQLENLSTGNACTASILDCAFNWPCQTLTAIDGYSGWQLQQIDIAACGALPGDILNVKFSLQITVSQSTPNTVVHLFSHTRVDDVRVVTLLHSGDTPAGPSDKADPQISLTVQTETELGGAQVTGGPRSEAPVIEAGNGAVIDCGDGGDEGNRRISLGSLITPADDAPSTPGSGTSLSERR